MGRGGKIAANISVALFVVGYLVFSAVLDRKQAQEAVLTDIVVEIDNSDEVNFITAYELREVLKDSLCPLRIKLSEVSLPKIDSFLLENPYIKSHRVYLTMDGLLKVRLSQRRAVVHLVDSVGGYDFYTDSTARYVLEPVVGYRPDVLTVYCKVNYGFKNSYLGEIEQRKDKKDIDNLKKLCNFVGHIERSAFMGDFLQQIIVEETPQGLEVQLIPNNSGTTIFLGSIDDAKEKLEILEHFYRRAYRYAKLDSARQVDLRYDSQIVVR